MCTTHQTGRISRRGFATMAMAGVGLSLLPLRARAADLEFLCITCIDYRFVTRDVQWLDATFGYKKYDIVALAGASLAALETKVPQHPKAFWDQVDIAQSLHRIKKVVLLDHLDCGAYKVANGYPVDQTPPPALEIPWHEKAMREAARLIHDHSDLGLRATGYLMPETPGEPTLIIPG